MGNSDKLNVDALRLGAAEAAADKVAAGGFAEAVKQLASVKSVSDQLRTELQSHMASYGNASSNLKDAMEAAINSVRENAGNERKKSMGFEMDESLKPLNFPKLTSIAPNPILKTNQLLGELKAEIAELGDLTAATAAVQEKQAELVDTILKTFVEGAQAAEKAGKQNLKIAKIGIFIALVAIALTVVQILVDRIL